MLVLCAGFFDSAVAHELQPGSLEVRQLTAERYEVIWRAPIYFKKPHPAKLQLPEHWQTVGEPTIKQLSDSTLYRRVVSVPNGTIDGGTIRFIGLEATITDVFVRFIWLDGTNTTAIARPGHPFVEIIAERSAWQVAGDYTVLGVDHILSGFDHLTFVLALLLIVSGARRLLITVTSFTLAHSITLAAATLGVMSVPGPPVEATIALSILFLASELVKVNQGRPSLTAQFPWIVAFVFGLLRFCRCTQRCGTAAKRSPVGAFDVQCRRGTGATDVYCGHPGADDGVAQAAFRVASLDTTVTRVQHWWHCCVLVD